MTTQGLLARIYRNSRDEDPSKGGISSYCDTVTIVGTVDRTSDYSNTTVRSLPTRMRQLEPQPDMPPVVAVFRGSPVGNTVHLEPLDEPDSIGFGRYTDGGSFAAAADSRLADLLERFLTYRFYGAIALHDRRAS